MELNFYDIKHKLSDREYEIFILIGEGFDSKTISKQLNIAVSTTETHRKNIRKKLKLINTNRNKLFEIAYKHVTT